MNRVYEPHKSSILDLDANILCLGLYLLPILASLFFSSLRILGWAIPLAVFLLERYSPFVKFHAAQCIALQVVVVLINIVIGIFAALSAGASMLIGLNIFAIFSTLGLVGLVTVGLALAVFVCQIFAMIKSYQWISFRLPLFGQIAEMFVKE